jgi:ABC-2 type transport system permease protein
MKNIWAIAAREIKASFLSPVAYVAIAAFLFVSGLIFSYSLFGFNEACRQARQMQAGMDPDMLQSLNLNEWVIAPFLWITCYVLLAVVPFITMRLLAEEAKLGTDELLYTSPVSPLEIVAGKYLAALLILLVMLIVVFADPVILFKFGNPDLGPTLSGCLGVLLTAAAFVAVGLFASSLTKSQLVAALVCFAFLFVFLLFKVPSIIVKSMTVGIPSAKQQILGWLADLFAYLSLTEHFYSMVEGKIYLKDVVFYLSLIFFFLFLTLRVVESRRWR